MTMNDIFNQHINLTLFILDDLKATDNQKNLFRNLTRNLQRQVLSGLTNTSPTEIEAFIADSRSKNNDNTK